MKNYLLVTLALVMALTLVMGSVSTVAAKEKIPPTGCVSLNEFTAYVPTNSYPNGYFMVNFSLGWENCDKAGYGYSISDNTATMYLTYGEAEKGQTSGSFSLTGILTPTSGTVVPGQTYFLIVGVVDKKNNFIGGDYANSLAIPIP
jgi:hypothetical protein